MIPPVVAESSSEAVFIASRLLAQDQQLAQHAQQGTAPFLADGELQGPAAAAVGSPAASSGSGTRNLLAEGDSDDLADGVDGDPDLYQQQQQQESEQHDESAAAAAAAAKAKPTFKLMQPVIVFEIAGSEPCNVHCICTWLNPL